MLSFAPAEALDGVLEPLDLLGKTPGAGWGMGLAKVERMKAPLRFGLVAACLFGCSVADGGDDGGCQTKHDPTACFGDEAPKGDDGLALGANARVRSNGTSTTAVDFEATVDRPDVVRLVDSRGSVSSCAPPEVRVRAVAEGSARISFRHSDGTTSARTVTVSPVSRVEVVPFLDRLGAGVRTREGESLPAPKSNDLRQVEGGAAVWEIVAFGANDAPLRGNGFSSLVPPAGTNVLVVESSSDRELFELSAPAALTSGAEVRTGALRTQISLAVVPASEIRAVRLYVEDDSKAVAASEGKAADRLRVLARAEDASSRAVHGVGFSFELGAVRLPAGGEVLTYDADPGATPRVLVATADGTQVRAETSLRIAPEGRAERSSARDYSGCSYAPGSRSSFPGFVLVVGALTLLRGRAVRRRASP